MKRVLNGDETFHIHCKDWKRSRNHNVNPYEWLKEAHKFTKWPILYSTDYNDWYAMYCSVLRIGYGQASEKYLGNFIKLGTFTESKETKCIWYDY